MRPAQSVIDVHPSIVNRTWAVKHSFSRKNAERTSARRVCRAVGCLSSFHANLRLSLRTARFLKAPEASDHCKAHMIAAECVMQKWQQVKETIRWQHPQAGGGAPCRLNLLQERLKSIRQFGELLGTGVCRTRVSSGQRLAHIS